MSSSSRASRCTIGALLVMLVCARTANAMNVHAVYRTACDRELGIILKVEKRNISLLTLRGEILTIPRHEIVSLAYYPVSQLPASRLPPNPSVPALDIKTLFEGEVVDLAVGWPMDYSESKISFLLESGRDIVIEKDSIWSLEFVRKISPLTTDARTKAIEFAHPQTAGFCAQGSKPVPGTVPNRVVFAQQILNDRIVIKRELDRLQEGYEQILEFEQDQKFYPVSLIYQDRTALGIWASVLSRYGASKSRTNNFTPTLIDELHLGPFRYQHLFLSGAAPNTALLHAEAQSQIYYRFKAAYFHTSVFADPSLVLVGTKYAWRPEDLSGESLDDRLNEVFALEFGFDFGPISVELAPAVITQAIVKAPMLVDTKDDINMWRAGLRYKTRLWEAQVFGGAAREDSCCGLDESQIAGASEWFYVYGRANATFFPHPRITAITSLIYRRLEYSVQDASSGTNVTYDAESTTGAVQASVAVSHRFDVGGSAILEWQRRRADGPYAGRAFPKFALFTSFSF